MSVLKVVKDENNIGYLREKYPDGLTFIVGDTHGEYSTLKKLIEKIKFDPLKDRVYFTGDYNSGGNVEKLLTYISNYYIENNDFPGFHLIRGNHERELSPVYPLENMPDLFVIRKKQMNYYIAHAGMLGSVLSLISDDISKNTDKNVFAYKLRDDTVSFDAPLRQIIWSRRGLYTQKSRRHNWPTEEMLEQNHACIIHGHTPYCFFRGDSWFSYGDESLFFKNQHVFFSEDLQSFDIDSNVKGLYENGETYRGLTCVCIEALEEIAAANGRRLTVDGIYDSPSCVFSAKYIPNSPMFVRGDINRVLNATPDMKVISYVENIGPVFE